MGRSILVGLASLCQSTLEGLAHLPHLCDSVGGFTRTVGRPRICYPIRRALAALLEPGTCPHPPIPGTVNARRYPPAYPGSHRRFGFGSFVGHVQPTSF